MVKFLAENDTLLRSGTAKIRLAEILREFRYRDVWTKPGQATDR